MKIKVFLLFVFFSSSLVATAQKCKYDFEKTDPFTNKLTKSIFVNLKGPYAKMSLIKTEADYQVAMSLRFSDRLQETIEKGDSVMVKLKDNKILYFTAKDNYKPLYGSNATSKGNDEPYSVYTAVYTATIEQIKDLSISEATFAKIKVGSLAMLFELKEKSRLKLKEGAGCLL